MANATNKAFEKAKVHVSHLCSYLDLSELDLFKVLKDDQLVDEKGEPNQVTVSHVKEENTNTP